MAVEIVRLKDGLDVITDTNYLDDQVCLQDPMIFELRNQNLVLQQWLPLAVIKNSKVSIHKSEVLCTMEPNEDFKEYYMNTVENLQNELRNIKKERDAGLDVVEAINELSMNKDINIH
jgi:hypothetical protein